MSSKFHKSNVKQNNGLPSIAHLKKIQDDFPNVKILKKTWDSFQIELQLQPSPISPKYGIRILYEKKGLRFL